MRHANDVMNMLDATTFQSANQRLTDYWREVETITFADTARHFGVPDPGAFERWARYVYSAADEEAGGVVVRMILVGWIARNVLEARAAEAAK